MFARGVTRSSLVIVAVLALVAIVAAAVSASMASGKRGTKTITAQPCGDRIFGHIRTLARTGDHYRLGFDPAFFTSGATANAAAAEDGAVEPGQPVPNDNYIVDESHRVLTYLVPETAHVTILTRDGDPQQLGATESTVSELEHIVNGGEHRPLSESLDSGLWIRVHGDTVCALDQQYRA